MKKHGLAVTANGEKSQIPSKFIIHIDVSGGNYKKKMVEALNKVEEMKLKTVAFPAMGTGMIYINSAYPFCTAYFVFNGNTFSFTKILLLL